MTALYGLQYSMHHGSAARPYAGVAFDKGIARRENEYRLGLLKFLLNPII